MVRPVHIGLMALVLTAPAGPATAAPIDAPRLVSRADGRSGAPANHAALNSSLSTSGRYATFWSESTNLSRKSGGLTIPRAYLRDTYRHRTVTVSDFSNAVLVSGDSSAVAWGTGGGDLTDHEVSVERRVTRRFRAVPDLVDGLAYAHQPEEYHDLSSISADGMRVAFVRQTTGSGPEIVVADLRSHTLIRVTGPAGPATPSGTSRGVHLSGDGRFVTFTSEAGDLVPGDTNGAPDAFLADLETGAITLVDRTAEGAPADRGAEAGAIDYFGRHITFSSRADDLDPAATNGVRQVYMRDTDAGTTIAVSRRTGAAGALGNRDAGASTISNDGRLIAFATNARNLSHRHCSGSNIVLRDVRRSTTRLVRRPARLSGRCTMTAPVLSDGSHVAFVARGLARKRTREVYVARTR
jgi:TolB protein